MRQINLDGVIDTSRYENIDRMQSAFVAFTDSIIQKAVEIRMAVPYESWQELWEPFQRTGFYYDGLGVPHTETVVSNSPYDVR
jgi:hypothetical protein